MANESFEAIAYTVRGDEVTVDLVSDISDAESQLTVRVIREPAPGYGWEERVELVDVTGDPDGAAWLHANAGSVIRQCGYRAAERGEVATWN